MLTQIIINGLMLAGSYALVAVGLTLIFGVMRMVNFAEGQSVMIGAFVAFTTAPYLGYVGAIAAAMAVNAVLGIILERTAFRPFRGVELNGLIASMGMSIILVNIAELVWGTTPRPFDTSLNQISITIRHGRHQRAAADLRRRERRAPARPVVAGAVHEPRPQVPRRVRGSRDRRGDRHRRQPSLAPRARDRLDAGRRRRRAVRPRQPDLARHGPAPRCSTPLRRSSSADSAT